MANSGAGELLPKRRIDWDVETPVLRSKFRNTEGRIGDESYIKYSDIDLFTVYVQLVLSGLDRIRLGGQDSARRSGTG